MSTPTIPLIRQYPFFHVTSTLEHMNVDVGRVLSLNGIPDWRHHAAEQTIPLFHFIKALEAGARATGEDTFGILVSESNNLDKYASWGEAMIHALTVYDAVNIACQHASKQANTIRVWLAPGKDGVLFCRKQLAGSVELGPGLKQLERYTITLLVNIVRLGAGRAWTPPWAGLSVENDNLLAEWPELANTSIEFCTPHSAIFVPDEILRLPLQNPSWNTHSKGEIAKKRIQKIPKEQDFVDDLRELVKILLSLKSANLDTAAEVTFLSTRTLQRRLAVRGHTFKSIVSQARYQMAVDILDHSDASVTEVSESLGYEHPQHFIRTFRQWSGVTPGKYRELSLIDPPSRSGISRAEFCRDRR